MVTETVGVEIPEWVIAEHEAALEVQRAQEQRREHERQARADHVRGVLADLLDDLLPRWRSRLDLEFMPDGTHGFLRAYCESATTAPTLHVGPIICRVLADAENDLTLMVFHKRDGDYDYVSLSRRDTAEENWRTLGAALYAAYGRIAEAQR